LETIRKILVAVDGSKLFDASSEAIDLAKTWWRINGNTHYIFWHSIRLSRRPNNSQIAPALKDVMTDVCYAKSRDACRKGNERGPS